MLGIGVPSIVSLADSHQRGCLMLFVDDIPMPLYDDVIVELAVTSRTFLYGEWRARASK